MRSNLQRHVASLMGNMNTENQSNTCVFPPDVRLSFPQLDVSIAKLENPGAIDSEKHYLSCYYGCLKPGGGRIIIIKVYSHRFHVILWLERNLQDFGAADDLLVAGGGDGFASNAVDLIESVRLQDALVCRANEDLQSQRLLASVSA